MTVIGLVGVGLMGTGIGLNMIKHGHEVVAVAHRKREGIEELLGLGAREVKTPREVAEAAPITIVCVTGSPQFRAAAEGKDGLIAGLGAGKILIDCTTGEPKETLGFAEAVTATGAGFADAPLARTPVEAREGRSNAMVGATPEVFEAILPILKCFCENIFHVGAPGSGAHLKVINNLIAMGQAVLIAEAVVACKAAGIDLAKFYEVISKGGTNSAIFQMVMKSYVESGSFDGMKFSLANAQKDLRNYTRMSMDFGLVSPMGALVHNQLVLAQAMGFPEGTIGHLVAAALKAHPGVGDAR